jgi:hypothetical protein
MGRGRRNRQGSRPIWGRFNIAEAKTHEAEIVESEGVMHFRCSCGTASDGVSARRAKDVHEALLRHLEDGGLLPTRRWLTINSFGVKPGEGFVWPARDEHIWTDAFRVDVPRERREAARRDLVRISWLPELVAFA